MTEENFDTIEKRLRNLKTLGAEVPFRDGLRLRLVEKMQGTTAPTHSGVFGARFALALSLIVIFLAGGSVVLAENSLPGQTLYPVKRSMENVRLVFVSDEDKEEAEKSIADNRLEELEEAVRTDDEEAAILAVSEVEESINKISLEAMSASNEYKTLIDQEAQAIQAKMVLEELLPILEEKEAKLAEIEEFLPEDEQVKVRVIRENLQFIKAIIENILNPVQEEEQEEESEEAVQGADTEFDNLDSKDPQATQ